MPDSHKPEMHVIKFPDSFGAEWRAETERHRQEVRRRYTDLMATALGDSASITSDRERAGVILDRLTVATDINSGKPCRCSCHPSLPDGDLHDYGFGCNCQKTPEERRRFWDEWEAESDAFWASPEGQRITAERDADEAALGEWLALHPEVKVDSHGGMAPEQWWGTIDGHSFYFRERHDDWRIELDLRPSGRFSNVWIGGDLDDPASLEQREIEIGEVIAEGTTSVVGYGDSPVARLQFVVENVRAHLRRVECRAHTTERENVERLLNRPLLYCPSCGTRVQR